MRKIITHSDSADIQCCVALLTSIYIYVYVYGWSRSLRVKFISIKHDEDLQMSC